MAETHYLALAFLMQGVGSYQTASPCKSFIIMPHPLMCYEQVPKEGKVHFPQRLSLHNNPIVVIASQKITTIESRGFLKSSEMV